MSLALLSAVCATMSTAPSPVILPQKKGVQKAAASRTAQIKRLIRLSVEDTSASDLAEKLVALGSEAIPYVIADLAKPGRYGGVNLTLTQALMAFGEPAKKPMLNALANGNVLQREGIIHAWREMASMISPRAPRHPNRFIEDYFADGREKNRKRWKFLYGEDIGRALTKALTYRGGATAGEAAESLGYLRVSGAVLALVPATQSREDRLATGAFAGLVSHLEPVDIDVAVQAFAQVMAKAKDDNNRFSRLMNMQDALTHTRTEVGKSLLRRLLASQDSEVRWTACRAYCIRYEPDALPLVEPLLKDDDADVRFAALAAVGNLGRGARYEEMVEAARSKDAYERGWGAYAAALTRKPEALEILLKLVADKQAVVRMMVARGLGRFDDPKADAALEKLQSDPNASVQTAAYDSVGEGE